MKNKIILVDVDGVLLDWRDAFMTYMKHHFDLDCKKDLSDATEHDVSTFYDLPKEEAETYIKNFNVGGYWEFGTLKPIDGAFEAIRKLSNIGYRFVAVTSCSTKPITVALRRANLFNHYGDVFDAVHCVDLYESKRTHLADHDPTFWIEDHYKNCVDGLDYGHKCILMDPNGSNNEKNDKINKFATWNQIVDFIEENADF